MNVPANNLATGTTLMHIARLLDDTSVKPSQASVIVSESVSALCDCTERMSDLLTQEPVIYDSLLVDIGRLETAIDVLQGILERQRSTYLYGADFEVNGNKSQHRN